MWPLHPRPRCPPSFLPSFLEERHLLNALIYPNIDACSSFLPTTNENANAKQSIVYLPSASTLDECTDSALSPLAWLFVTPEATPSHLFVSDHVVQIDTFGHVRPLGREQPRYETRLPIVCCPFAKPHSPHLLRHNVL